jgi:hypothetical protein
MNSVEARIAYRLVPVVWLLIGWLSVSWAQGAAVPFSPDPASVQHEGAGYRYPQAGWIVVHVEGEPYERGYQQGKLLAPEIAGYVRCFAATQSSKSPADGWKLTRTMVSSLFLHRYDPEYLEEMRGIADGAAAAGAKFHGRRIDLTDIVALNAWAELMTLDDANHATPTGLEGRRFNQHCSAFVACAPATADGKIVIGHTSMFDLYPSLFFNVWLDVQPTHGHRMSFQGYPGAINSAMDWYQTDAGLVVVETTIDQTKFDPNGQAEASRIRKAVQYADSVDDVVRLLSTGNNGLYANEWLIADMKHNEIAMLDLGTATSRVWRSSKHEWFGNTEGFYWSCNNEKDLNVRLETIPSVHDRPADVLFRPEQRDGIWVNLYEQNKGHIDESFAQLAFSTPVLVSRTSVDAKYTTTDLQKDLKCEALFGPPLGRGWEPTFDERKRYPEVYEMASNPWTLLSMKTSPTAAPSTQPALAAVDLDGKLEASARDDSASDDEGDDDPPHLPAWTGTLLPGNGGDAWLATAFATYEPIVADELSKLKDNDSGVPTPQDREDLGNELFGYRTAYLSAARETADTPLSAIRMDVADRSWYRIARGKGVLLLAELQRRLGMTPFIELMSAYGKAYAGKPADAAAFAAMAEQSPYNVPPTFFAFWLKQSGLPSLALSDVKSQPSASGDLIRGELRVSATQAISSVDVTVEMADDEKTQTIATTQPTVSFEIQTDKPAIRVAVNRYYATPASNGCRYSLGWFTTDAQKALIVYGTQDEEASNSEAARKLQKAIADAGSNIMIPIKADVEVMDDELLKNHHLLLIGRPSCNRITAKMEKAFHARFGEHSFTVGGKLYANANSALLIAGTNPLNDRYCVEVLAGLSAGATLRNSDALAQVGDAEAQVITNGESKELVRPAAELVHVFPVP